jgi:hypothetical protein
MDALRILLVVWLATLTLSSLVGWALWRPLRTMLGELCSTEHRSGFWLVYTELMIVLVPLTLATMFRPTGDLQVALPRALFFVLAGLVSALVGVGVVLWSKTPARSPE